MPKTHLGWLNERQVDSWPTLKTSCFDREEVLDARKRAEHCRNAGLKTQEITKLQKKINKWLRKQHKTGYVGVSWFQNLAPPDPSNSTMNVLYYFVSFPTGSLRYPCHSWNAETPLFEWFSSCFACFAALNSCLLQEGSVKLVKELHYILVRLYGRMVTDGILIYTDGHCRCFFDTTSNQLLATVNCFPSQFLQILQRAEENGAPSPPTNNMNK